MRGKQRAMRKNCKTEEEVIRREEGKANHCKHSKTPPYGHFFDCPAKRAAIHFLVKKTVNTVTVNTAECFWPIGDLINGTG